MKKAADTPILELSREIFKNIARRKPIVHNISNIVTANDCANMTLACGGSPTMADDPGEVEEITAACNGFVLNMGNTGGFYPETMLRAGRQNNKVNHPLVLDPVGAGAAKHRNEILDLLLREIHFSVIRGNISEIRFIGDKSSAAKGVDAAECDLVTEEKAIKIAEYAKNLSRQLDTVIAISSPLDIVACGSKAYLIRNGHPVMSRVTGTGCMLSSAIGVFIAANPEYIAEATTVAMSAYGYAGELAARRMEERGEGTGSFRTYLLDFMSTMDISVFEEGARIEEI